MEAVHQLLIMSPNIFLFFYVLLYLMTNDTVWIMLLLLGVVLSLVNKFVLKNIFRQARPSMKSKYGCHGYSYGKDDNSFGMPSGHAISISLFLVAMIHALRDNIFEKSILIAFCVIAVLHRVYLGCHTILQVIAGSLVGISAYYLAMNAFYSTRRPSDVGGHNEQALEDFTQIDSF